MFLWYVSHAMAKMFASGEAEGIFNKWYQLPLGGLNFDDYISSMWMDQIKPLTGRGRSVSFNLIVQF